jgi:DedD protein
MANVSAAAENADQLRRRANRRLLGASVLLLIAIILVPIFLEREPPPLPDNVDVKIPPVEGTKFDPKLPDRKAAPTEVPAITEPSGAQASVAAAGAATTAVAAATKEATKEASKDATKSTKADAPKAPESAPEKTAEKASPKSSPALPDAAAKQSQPKSGNGENAAAPSLKTGQLVIQLVAVRDPQSAREVFDKAKSLKFPAYTEQLTVSNGVVTRVRVGPYDNKQAADAARAKLAQAGFEAKVLTLP